MSLFWSKKDGSNVLFDKDKILEQMESLRRANGAFIASQTDDYTALWIRDHLYATYAYWYLGEYDKLREGIWLIFDLFKKYKHKLLARISSPADAEGNIIHAKYSANDLEQITDSWGHLQFDALGLFINIVADLRFKYVENIIRDDSDKEIIQLVVFYLRSLEYWVTPDNGIWEECFLVKTSSLGAVLAGLSYLKRMRLAFVDDSLIEKGQKTFRDIFPNEAREIKESHERCHGMRSHSHDCDAAQLTLIWPFHWISDIARQDIIISRIFEGHRAENGEQHKLLQMHGLNRYWGDPYEASNEGIYNGISAEWPMFFFWLSIIFSQRRENEKALYWFEEGVKTITSNGIPEAYKNGKPNKHTPLAWAHAIALIAWIKLQKQ